MMGLLARELVVKQDPDVRQDLKAIAGAALSAKHLEDIAVIEERVRKIEEHDAQVVAERKNGLRNPGANTAAGTSPVAGPPVH